MKYILKADLNRVKDKEKLYNGFVSRVEYGTWVHGTIEELMAFKREVGVPLIIGSNNIEIYDGYRE